MFCKFQRIVYVALCIVSLQDSIAQERFVKWLTQDEFIMAASTNKGEKLFKVSLPEMQKHSWSEKEKRLPQMGMVGLGGDRIMQIGTDLFSITPEGVRKQLTFDDAPEKNARISGDKRKIAYTKLHDLYVYDLETGIEKRLTFDGSETVYNGWASWVYYEEILGRASNYAAFWWSPDSEKLSFLHFDDTHVPSITLFRSEGQHGDLEVQKYPKAGDRNPDVQIGVADVTSGNLTWIHEDKEKDQYTAFPFWTPDSKHILFQELNRAQDTLHLVKAQVNDGSRVQIYEETHKTWVEFFEEMHFISDDQFIIRSNKDGWYNYYSYDLTGKLIAHITPVPWRVTSLASIDQEKKTLYFYGCGPVNTEQHFYSVGLDGTGLKQITKSPGWHTVDSSPESAFFLDRYSSLDQTEMSRIMDGKGEVIHAFESKQVNPNAIAGIIVEDFTVPTPDGFDLPGYWVLPKGFDSTKKYPVVFSVYGGPNYGRVENRFISYTADFYANNDMIRIVVDHRGSGKFGRKGMDFLHRSLGKWEMKDYITVVEWLQAKPFVDASRVAITGSSYGGYVTCMALTEGADYFSHGISLYPVTDWALYDNVYTERYMDMPVDNPEGYRYGSASSHVESYKGKLLIVHGMMDENVHIQNTMQFVSKMQDLGKEFEMMVYPGERHGWGGPKRRHLDKLTNDFWRRHVLNVPKE